MAAAATLTKQAGRASAAITGGIAGIFASPWITLATLGAIVFVIYSSGKSAGKRAIYDPSSLKLPTGTGPKIPAGWSPVPMSETLFKAMKGYLNWGSDLGPIFQEYAQLPNDEMFIAVYSVFNQAYGKRNSGTLREWIEGTWYMVLFGHELQSRYNCPHEPPKIDIAT